MKRKNQTKIYSWEEMSNMTLTVPDCSAYEMVKQSALRHQNAPAYDYMGKQCTYKELIEKGEDVKYEDVLADVNQRDYQDSHREIAPLKPSEDSVMADTSELDLQGSIDLIVSIIKENI